MRDDGRGRTPALGSRGAASSHAGFAALSLALQQTAVHPAAVAGGAVPDALRRLHLSRSRSTPARAPRVARRIAIAGGARFTPRCIGFCGGWRTTTSIADCREPCVGRGAAGAEPLLPPSTARGSPPLPSPPSSSPAW